MRLLSRGVSVGCKHPVRQDSDLAPLEDFNEFCGDLSSILQTRLHSAHELGILLFESGSDVTVDESSY